jgi:uncharacterized protein YjbI with pentapeptide repeats
MMKLQGPNGKKVKFEDGGDFSGFQIDKQLVSPWGSFGVRRASFRGARLFGPALSSDSSGTFEDCDFTNATVEIWTGGKAKYLRFDRCNFEGATINVPFEWCNFAESSFKGANLTGTEFRHCNFSYANFSGALITEQQFRYPYDEPEFNKIISQRYLSETSGGSQREVISGVVFPIGGFSD